MEAHTKMDIEVPLDRVGERLFDFAGLHLWHPGVSEMTVEGEGVGSIRTYKLANDLIVERLDSIEEDGRGISYTVLNGPIPVTDFHAVYSIVKKDGATRVMWLADFEVGQKELGPGMRRAARGLQEATLSLLKLSLELGLDLTQ